MCDQGNAGQQHQRKEAIRRLISEWDLGKLYSLYEACSDLADYLGQRAVDAWPDERSGAARAREICEERLFRKFPGLSGIVDIEEVTAAIQAQEDSPETLRRVVLDHLSLPMDASRALAGRQGQQSPGKAEEWLAILAQRPAPNFGYEALVYFLSRGKEIPDHARRAEAIRGFWHTGGGEWWDAFSRMTQVVHPVTGGLRRKVDAKRRTKAAGGLPSVPRPLRFWGQSVTDDATVLRAAEWLGLGEFDTWWRRLGEYLLQETFRQTSEFELPAIRLFSLCRADKALDLMPDVLGASYRALVCTEQDPWRLPAIRAGFGEDGWSHVDSVAIAATIVFASHRVPGGIAEPAIARNAERFLVGRQSQSGAWPMLTEALGETGGILQTAMAIHALALGRPSRWQSASQRAAEWLWNQQSEFGHWTQPELSPSYLSVLVLDAVELAWRSGRATWRVPEGIAEETAAEENGFHHTGKGWLITYGGRTIALGESAGLPYIHVLLGNQHKPALGLEQLLSAATGKHVPPLTTREAHDGRLEELGEELMAVMRELSDTEEGLDDDVIAKLTNRKECLADEIRKRNEQASKIKDKLRVEGSKAGTERRRVGQAIKRAIDQIRSGGLPELADHLVGAIHGEFSASASQYRPQVPVEWQL